MLWLPGGLIGVWSGVHCSVGGGRLGMGAGGGTEWVLGFRSEWGWVKEWVLGHPGSVWGSQVWRWRGEC